MNRWSAVGAIVARDSLRSLKLATPRFAFPALLLFELFVTIAIRSDSGFPVNLSLHEFFAAACETYVGVAIFILTLIGIGTASGTPAQIIGRERREDTWTLLRAAPMRSGESAFAILVSALATALAPAVAHLPLLIFALALMDSSMVAAVATIAPICLALCVAAAATGTFFATLIRRTELATLAAALAMMFFAGGGQILIQIASSLYGWTFGSGALGSVVRWLLGALHDASAIHQIYGIWIGAPSVHGIAISMVTLALVTLVCFLGATRFIHRDGVSVPRGSRKLRVSEMGVNSLFPISRPPISDHANPFFVLEVRRSYLGHPVLAIPLACAAIAVYLPFATMMAWFEPKQPVGAFALLVVAMAMPLIAGMTVSASLISREREANTFDLIAMTASTPREILRGKTAAAALQVVPAFLVVFLSFLPFWYFGGKHFSLFAACMLTLAVSLAVEISAGGCATVVTRSVREASVFARVFSFTLLIGVTVIAGIASAFESSLLPGPGIIEQLTWITSPIMAFAWFSLSKFDVVIGEPIGAPQFTVALLLFVALAAGLYGLAHRMFAREFPAVGVIAYRRRADEPLVD